MVAVKYLSHTESEKETRKVLLSFAKSIQERDIVTYEHSHRVAVYAQRLARHLEWPRQEARDLALAALVHDLGKTWIGNDILNKSAALSAEERRKMQSHPVIGARILIGCDVSPFYVETVLYHHEAWNGQGYPTGLKGEDIPVSARILAIADVYDVLTSQRPYKAPLTVAEARERMRQGSGINFDPTLLQAFLHLLDIKPNFTLHDQHEASLAEPETSLFYTMSMAGFEVHVGSSHIIGRRKSTRI
ncbi:MAG TPA: HD-GYP domain-containing protein [Ktedonobacteraceae bacterium]|jgi:putative two-component system response regulator|nr:HD-GYP domain-containing protein [Ktedonobacteraceae bacterium]